MRVFHFLVDTLFDPRLNYYITIVQVPIVLCLAIQSYQAFRLGFRDFKLISVAWCVNIFYLVINIISIKTHFDQQYTLVARTFADLLCMGFFLFAIVNSLESKPFNKLKTLRKGYFVFFIFLAGISKTIPGATHIIPYIHLRFVPAAVVDFSILLLLCIYFGDFAEKFGQKRSSYLMKILFCATLLYAIIQFLWVLQAEPNETNLILNIDNIGFSLGLISKTGILICLSILLIRAINAAALNEKNKLLHKLTFAANILNIKDHLFSTKTLVEQEDDILESVLNECLNLLNERLGYFALFDDKNKEVRIQFASKDYQHKIGYSFSFERGMTGKAIRTKQIQIRRNKRDNDDYFQFDSPEDKNVESAASIPVILDEKAIGVYMFESEQEDYFTKTDVDILNAIVSQASTAIKNIQLVQEIELSKTLLNSLKLIDKFMVGKSLELKKILGIILKHAQKLAMGDLGNIALKTPKPNELVIVASTDERQIGKIIDIHDSISGLAVKEKRHVYIPDINKADDEKKRLYKQFFEEDDIICELVVPLIVQNQVIGIFNNESKEVDKFTKSDIGKIKGFAGQAAIAIHIFQLFEEVKKHKSSLEALAEIDLLILNSNQNLLDTLDAILKKGMKLLNKKYGEIFLLSKNETGDNCLIVKKSTDIEDEGRTQVMKSICGMAFKNNRIVYVPFIDKTEKKPAGVDENVLYIPSETERLLYKIPKWGKMKSELVLPLVLRGEVIGVFNIESEHYNDFSESDVNLLVNLTHAAAIAIHNAQQFEEIKNKNIELQNSVDKDKIKMSSILGKVINHRIGNSVGMIRIKLLDFLDGEYGEFNDEVRQEFEVMLKSAEKVIDARAEISKKMEELLVAKPSPINFSEVKTAIEQFEEFNIDPKIAITVTGLDDLSPVLIDFNLFMDGVVLELIRNAIKSMPVDGGSVSISGIADGSFNVLNFTDNGCGIEELEKDRIFEEGWSKWSKGKGGGIGLFELKTIIEFFRGAIDVKSEVGKGSTFTIKLPRY